MSEADAPALSPRLTNRSNQITHREPIADDGKPLKTTEHELSQVGFTDISGKKISGFAVLYRISNLFFAANPKGALKGSVGAELDLMNVTPQLAVYEMGPDSGR